MCVEFFQSGTLNVYRTHDAEMLRAIKRGEWTLESVKALAERLFADARTARDASGMPDAPDYKRVSDLVADLTASSLELQ